jgi:hypothetical protein
LGSSLQYWYGNVGIPSDFRTMLLSFDEDGVFDDASMSQISYPKCWRVQERDETESR